VGNPLAPWWHRWRIAARVQTKTGPNGAVYYGRDIGGLSMPNFVTFDDGLNYISISEIEAFGYNYDETNKGGTFIKLRNGRTIQT
jgi:hypothetical protein